MPKSKPIPILNSGPPRRVEIAIGASVSREMSATVQAAASKVLGMVELLSEVLSYAFHEHEREHDRRKAPVRLHASTRTRNRAFRPALVCKLWWDIASDHLWRAPTLRQLLRLLAPVELGESEVYYFKLTVGASTGLHRSKADRFLNYAKKVRFLLLDSQLSPNLAAELEAWLPPHCFPRLTDLSGGRVPVSQLLLFLSRSPRLTGFRLAPVQRRDASFSELAEALGPSSPISLRRLTVMVESNRISDVDTPFALLVVDACVKILHMQTSITGLRFELPVPEQLVQLCSQMVHLHDLTSCELSCHWTSSEAWVEVSDTLALNCPRLQVLRLESLWSPSIFFGQTLPKLVSFEGLISPLLSLHDLQDLSINMDLVLLPISSDQVSSMAAAWPKMRQLELASGSEPSEYQQPMAFSSLLAFREFGDSLEKLTVAVSFDDLLDNPEDGLPEDGIRCLKNLSELGLLFDEHPDPSVAVYVAEVFHAVCLEQTHISINGRTFKNYDEEGWQDVYDVLQALRRARKKTINEFREGFYSC